jgi:hypothetical protein
MKLGIFDFAVFDKKLEPELSLVGLLKQAINL